MLPKLTPVQARILGCLMEKSVVTPDQYPLTLNSLTNACNQKSSRDPVMSLEQGEVQRAARELAEESLVQIDENFRTGVEKYKQRLCNTSFSDFQFDPAQFAVITLLLLRGPQTPGELRTRSGRLHAFEDNDAVIETLSSLLHRGGSDPLVIKLPRQPGRKDSEYMHRLGGSIDIKAHLSEAGDKPAEAPPPKQNQEPPPPPPKPAEPPARPKPAETTPPPPPKKAPEPPVQPKPAEPPAAESKQPDTDPGISSHIDQLVKYVEKLEAEVADLKAQLAEVDELKEQLAEANQFKEKLKKLL